MASRAEMVALREQGLTYQQIADRLGVTRNVVVGKVHQTGPSKRPLRDVTDEEVAAAMAEHGNNLSAVARVLGVNRTQLWRKGFARPEQLSDRPTRDLCEMIRTSGVPVAVIARRAGVYPELIRRWMTGRHSGTAPLLQWVREALDIEKANRA